MLSAAAGISPDPAAIKTGAGSTYLRAVPVRNNEEESEENKI
jgi:hypothetical protein